MGKGKSGFGGGLGGLLGLLLGGGKGYGGKGQWTPKFKIDKAGGELGEFTGTIKSFVNKTGYGFIECPELAEHGDIFLHAAMKKGYREGQTVKFTCVLTKEGKPNAINLKSGLK